jgi:2-dehydropantoate 2-reductase
MKVCVFGAGAIGGYVAASLARAGEHDVSAVARGRQLAAMKDGGLTIQVGPEKWRTPISCTGNAAELGPQDAVLVTVKAPTIPAAVDQLKALIGPQTTVAFLMNGIPWWYYYRHGGSNDGKRIAKLDPDGQIWDTIGPERVLGGVIYCSATVISPGVIGLDYADVRFETGEPDGSDSPRLKAVVEMLAAAGSSNFSREIRKRIWAKLVLNMATGPSAVLARTSLRDLFAEDGVRQEIEAMLVEALAIADAVGNTVDLNITAAVAKIAKSAHKPSILQDLEAGRAMEIDGLYGIPLEMGKAHGIDSSKLELLTALVKVRAKSAGLY